MCRANFKGVNDMDIEYNNGKLGENICRLINKGFTKYDKPFKSKL